MKEKKLVNPFNHIEQSLNPDNEISHLQEELIDGETTQCDPEKESNESLSWLEDSCKENTGLGSHNLCDPMQKGKIINDENTRDPDKYNSSTIYRYSKAIRGCDEAMTDLFRDIVVLDIDGKAHPVPIIWGSQERAVAFILQDQVRKDNSLVVDRPRLPVMAIYQTGTQFNQERYVYHQALDYKKRIYPGEGPEYDLPKPGFTVKEKYERDTVFGVARGLPIDVTYKLVIWTLYIEDMNQIVEQIYLKFSPISYINVRGVDWEIGVKLQREANNLDVEPGEKMRVIKYEFDMMAESFIPQPIVRKKSVLRQRINVFDNIQDEELSEVIKRLEIAVKELS